MPSQAAHLQVVAPPAWRIVDREPERVGLWIEAHGGGFWRPGATCIGHERHGELVAGVMYEAFNGSSLHTSIAAVGKHWLTREYLWFIFHYPFVQLGARLLIATVASDNFDSRKFCEHLGFDRHSRIPDAHPSGALLVYTFNKAKCKWLRLKEKKNVEG